MKNFLQIAAGLDVMPLLLELQRNAHLWDKNPLRLSRTAPHYETSDIVLRARDERPHIESCDWKNFSDEHISTWYQNSDMLPAAKPFCFDLMKRVNGEQLGGVFIYRLKPGAQIYPHVDTGWHPEFYDKYNICLQSNPQAAFYYDDERMVQRAGDVHFFRNDSMHGVINEGDTDHIVMIVCIRSDRGERCPWSPEGWTFDQQFKGE